MKLHSEISVSWMIVYACILVSISGRNSLQAIQTIQTNVPSEDSINEGKLIEHFQDSSNSYFENVYIGAGQLKK